MFAARNMTFASALDPAIIALRNASGAPDLAGLNTLASYIRGQGLISQARGFPMKTAQNAGSGSTVYGYGDLTANNMTLVNSPTWSASGIAMNTTTQFGHMADFLDAETITVFVRRSGTLGAVGTPMVSQLDFTGNQRSWAITASSSSTSVISVRRSPDGSSALQELYNGDASSLVTADTTYVAQWSNGGGRNVWTNKTERTLTLVSGPQTSRLNATAAIMLNAFGTVAVPSGFMGGTYLHLLIVRGTITTPQRETITDLINAL